MTTKAPGINRFLAWLELTGTAEVAKLLETTPQTVRNWKRAASRGARGANATRPSEALMRRVVEVSAGRVSIDDIFAAFP